MKNCPLFISPTFSDLGSADAFCQAFLLSVKNQGISLPCFMPQDNTIQGYHSKGQRGHGEKAAAKLKRILVARELEWRCAWMGRLNVRHSLLGSEDHPKEAGKCKSDHTLEGRPVQCQNACPLVFFCLKSYFFWQLKMFSHRVRLFQLFSMLFTVTGPVSLQPKQPMWLICQQTHACMLRHVFSFTWNTRHTSTYTACMPAFLMLWFILSFKLDEHSHLQKGLLLCEHFFWQSWCFLCERDGDLEIQLKR